MPEVYGNSKDDLIPIREWNWKYNIEITVWKNRRRVEEWQWINNVRF